MRVTEKHTHSPNRLRLRAQIEERSVVDTYVAASVTEHVRPNQIVSKVGYPSLLIVFNNRT